MNKKIEILEEIEFKKRVFDLRNRMETSNKNVYSNIVKNHIYTGKNKVVDIEL